jgi:hypothetical protein
MRTALEMSDSRKISVTVTQHRYPPNFFSERNNGVYALDN